MTETLLNKISKYSNDTIVTNAWLTGQTGEIVDLKGDCIFRFIDFINDGELRLKHTTEDSKLACPIVACGFIVFWRDPPHNPATSRPIPFSVQTV